MHTRMLDPLCAEQALSHALIEPRKRYSPAVRCMARLWIGVEIRCMSLQNRQVVNISDEGQEPFFRIDEQCAIAV